MQPALIAAFLVPISICGTVLLLGLRILSYKQASRRAAQAPGDFAAVERRLARVEVALDDVTNELGRLSEGQQVLTKLLAERVAEHAVLPGARPLS